MVIQASQNALRSYTTQRQRRSRIAHYITALIVRSRGKRFARNLQSNHGQKYYNAAKDGALGAVNSREPLKELGEDETGLYPLNE